MELVISDVESVRELKYEITSFNFVDLTNDVQCSFVLDKEKNNDDVIFLSAELLRKDVVLKLNNIQVNGILVNVSYDVVFGGLSLLLRNSVIKEVVK